MEFKILKKSKKSQARIGLLKTAHGEIETPSLVAVATQAAIKSLSSEEAKQAKVQIGIANTFHLHLRPGENTIKKFGGLHKFMNWDRPLMTDSGGFQVLSLGFGRDFGIGKVQKTDSGLVIGAGSKPKSIKISADGVMFKSPLDGKEIFLGPKESIRIQEKLGADIIFAFDECSPSGSDFDYNAEAMRRTHDWAKICLKTKKTKQALFGIVQGGKFRELREKSSRFIGSLDFDGFGIGGEFGSDKTAMAKIIRWGISGLPEQKPRHLLGIGYLEDIPKIIKEGIDLFDCLVPTRFARHGIAFVSSGKIDLKKSSFTLDQKPLDKKCACSVCANYSRGYIHHLFKAKEMLGPKLLTLHNLFFFNDYIEKIRKEIKAGKS